MAIIPVLRIMIHPGLFGFCMLSPFTPQRVLIWIINMITLPIPNSKNQACLKKYMVRVNLPPFIPLFPPPPLTFPPGITPSPVSLTRPMASHDKSYFCYWECFLLEHWFNKGHALSLYFQL